MSNVARYIAHTEEDVKRFLEFIGLEKVEDLFDVIPERFLLQKSLDLPNPLDESKLVGLVESLAAKNRSDETLRFLGAGAYDHVIPKLVSYLISRQEFLTAYTPYQPEVSQGTLQAIFEFQTLVCQLTEMDVANASLYDGATSCAEAVLATRRIARGKSKAIISSAIHPRVRDVVKTYTKASMQIVEAPYDKKTGRTDTVALKSLIDGDTACVVIQSPNFFGAIEDLKSIGELAKAKRTLFVPGFLEALSLGLLVPPGRFGADIAWGEGQSFGLPLSFGGPYIGWFSTKQEFVRQMPARLVGETVDKEGRRSFVMTLVTREQHIRRERATSNICTSQALCALANTITLTLLGKTGVRRLAELNARLAAYAKKLLSEIPGVSLRFGSPTFNEFVISTRRDTAEVLNALKKRGISGGIDISRFYPDEKGILICVTEKNGRDGVDRYVEALKDVARA